MCIYTSTQSTRACGREGQREREAGPGGPVVSILLGRIAVKGSRVPPPASWNRSPLALPLGGP
jgi:hypothetical protein